MADRCLYIATVKEFLEQERLAILGALHNNYHGEALTTTDEAWMGEIDNWIISPYTPTPTIIEAARARQGIIICVPKGNCRLTPEGFPEDPTRLPEFYDGTYEYLKSLGLEEI